MPVQTDLSEVDLIEDNLIGMSYSPESGYERQGRNDCEGELEIPF